MAEKKLYYWECARCREVLTLATNMPPSGGRCPKNSQNGDGRHIWSRVNQ